MDRIPIGLNTYCLRAMKWNDAQLLDYTAAQQLDAVFLQDSLDPRAQDPAHWIEVRDQAKRLGLHLETGVGAVLPSNAAAFAQSMTEPPPTAMIPSQSWSRNDAKH